MLRSIVIAAAGTLLASACVPSGMAPPDPVYPDGVEARWIEGPAPGVRTLLVQPTHAGRVDILESHAEVEVSVGAFFSRWETEEARLDQLALLIQLEGDDPEELVRLSHELLLQVDEALYVGEPGNTGNSFHMKAVPAGRQLSVAIPIGVEALENLVTARTVRGILGQRGAFAFPGSTRQRFTSLLRKMPTDGTALSGVGSGLRIADLTQ